MPTNESNETDGKTAALMSRLLEARDQRNAAMWEERASIRAAHGAGISIRKIAARLERSEGFVRGQLG